MVLLVEFHVSFHVRYDGGVGYECGYFLEFMFQSLQFFQQRIFSHKCFNLLIQRLLPFRCGIVVLFGADSEILREFNANSLISQALFVRVSCGFLVLLSIEYFLSFCFGCLIFLIFVSVRYLMFP